MMESTPKFAVPAALAALYPPLEFLGRGGQGFVYLANQAQLDRGVVVKVGPGLAGASLERFTREARLMSQLDHPAIPKVVDFQVEADWSYLVTVHEPGASLRNVIQSAGPLPWHDACALARDVAEGLAFAHSHGILHRDVSTGNVLVTRRGALILDFGLARDERETQQRLTRTRAALGTPLYMAPEVLTGDEATAASDVYSLGLVLFESLAGRLPFAAGSLHELIEKQVSERVKSLPPLAEPPPPAVAGLVLEMLEKNPARRTSSCAEVASRLALALKSPRPQPAVVPGRTARLPLPGMTEPGQAPGRRSPARGRRSLAVGLIATTLFSMAWWLSTERPRAAAPVLLRPTASASPESPAAGVTRAGRWLRSSDSSLSLDRLWQTLRVSSEPQRELDLRLPSHPLVRVLSSLGALPWPPEPGTATDRLSIEAGYAELATLLARCRNAGSRIPPGIEALLDRSAVRRLPHVPTPAGERLVDAGEMIWSEGGAAAGPTEWVRRVKIPDARRDLRIVLELHRTSDTCQPARVSVADARAPRGAPVQLALLAIDPHDAKNRGVFEIRLHPRIVQSGEIEVKLVVLSQNHRSEAARLVVADAYLRGRSVQLPVEE